MEATVLDWCRRYGLIGIVPMQAHLTMCETAAEPDDFSFLVGPIATSVSQRQSRRYSSDPSAGMDEENSRDHLFQMVDWLDERKSRKGGRNKVAKSLLRIPEQPYREMVEDWFGSKADTDYGSLETQDGAELFWTAYREPIEFFAAVAWQFLDEVEVLHTPVKDWWNTPATRGAEDLFHAIDYFDALSNSIDRHCERLTSAKELRDTRTTCSILAHFGDIAFEDSECGRRVYRCVNCGRISISQDSRARYCSPRCRKASVMRKYRSDKAAREHASG
jgi:hypothetical protein